MLERGEEWFSREAAWCEPSGSVRDFQALTLWLAPLRFHCRLQCLAENGFKHVGVAVETQIGWMRTIGRVIAIGSQQ